LLGRPLIFYYALEDDFIALGFLLQNGEENVVERPLLLFFFFSQILFKARVVCDWNSSSHSSLSNLS